MVEVVSSKDERVIKSAFVNVEEKVWVLCHCVDE